jgi:hypothetical protein
MNEERALFPLLDHTARADERARLVKWIVTF